jgi:hypothetical protein
LIYLKKWRVMRNIEIIGQWIFALFMAVVSFFCSIFLLVFLSLKLDGLSIGTKLPPDFHSSLNPTMFWIIAASMIPVPLIVASYVGAITAPNSQLGFASIVFPLSVFLFANIPFSGRANQRFDIKFVLESGASCAIAAVCLYFKWKRQQSKRNAMENVGPTAGPRI